MTNPKSPESNPGEMGGPALAVAPELPVVLRGSCRVPVRVRLRVLSPEEFLTHLDWELGNQVPVLLAMVAVVLTVSAVAATAIGTSITCPKTATFTS